jgi:hypothetical protein
MAERRSTRIVRWLGAGALLSVGVDHLYEYSAKGYRRIPTIGRLFLLNFISALLVALGLVIPLHRFMPRRLTDRVLNLLALSGIGIGAGTLGGLLISEKRPLFGFQEVGYRKEIVRSIVFDGASIVLLTTLLFLRARRPQ